MRVAIIGAGVYGTLAATALTEASVSATLITRAERQKQLIGARTKITSPFGRFTAPLLALTLEDAQGGSFDVVIISTRADAFERGVEIARSVTAPGGMVVSLVDGVGHLAGLVDRVPGCLVAAAHLDVRCSMDADGVLRQSGPPGRMRLGLMADTGAERLEALCSALDGRRFSARPESDTLLAEMWARHIFIAAAVGASIRAGGVPFRDALRFHSRRPFEKMMDEGVRIGAAHGVNRVFDAVRRYRTAALREGEPVQAPAPLGLGGGAADEARYLFDEMLQLARDARMFSEQFARSAEAGRKVDLTLCDARP